MYGRLVVAFVLAVVLAAVAISLWVAEHYRGQVAEAPTESFTLGPLTFLTSAELPPIAVIVMAVGSIAVVGLLALGFEISATLLTVNPRRNLLSRWRTQESAGVVEPSPVRVTCLIPAHNEEASLPATLASLAAQTRPPDRVIVIADNCTDSTAAIARDSGHEAFETVGNTHKKGGALNQALAWLLPESGPADVFLVMDADTSLSEMFIETGARILDEDPEMSAVGGIFYGDDGHGLVGQFQRNEYTRYSMQLKARHGRVFVLTGTATMFRADALLDVAAARGVFLPGQPGKVYDTAALTEDNELTLALKSLGASMCSPQQCRVTTEIMPTWSDLWTQRKRWQRGALENLAAHGFTRATARYWGQQVGIGYGVVALNLALFLLTLTLLASDRLVFFYFWGAIGAIFWLERLITVWKGGWKARGLSALLFPELLYDVFLQVVFVRCMWDITLSRRASWGRVQQPAAAVTSGEPA